MMKVQMHLRAYKGYPGLVHSVAISRSPDSLLTS